MKDIFISYKAEEYDEACWVRSVLENNGISCWMAPASIPGGSNYAIEIPQAIRNAKAFVLILSTQAQYSQWIPREVDIAINARKIILPFQVDNCELKDDFNFYLTNVQRYEAYKNKVTAIEEMLHRIKALIGDNVSQSSSVEPRVRQEPSSYIATVNNDMQVASETVANRITVRPDDTPITIQTKVDTTELSDLYENEQLRTTYNVDYIKKGDLITLGKYHHQSSYVPLIQEGDSHKEIDALEWLVLDVDNNRALVVSKYAIECKYFSSSGLSLVSWRTSSIRKWLNNDFLNGAFTEREKSIILTSTLAADKKHYINSPTQDKVFLLSIEEVNKYFTNDNERKCIATSYAAFSEVLCAWWLRTPGNRFSISYVTNTGAINTDGSFADSHKYVRPALWLDLTAIE